MTVTNFFDAQFGMIKYPLCGNYDDGDNEYECPNFDPEESPAGSDLIPFL